MTALAKDRNTPRFDGDVGSYPVLASAKIYAGSIVVLDSSGWAKPAVTATGLKCAGRAEAQVDNSAGGNGDLDVKVRYGVFRFANSAAADEITQAEVGSNAFIVDDQTVAKTDGTSTRSVAGRIEQVDDLGVWVRMGSSLLASPAGALVAANNLSDVAAAATAFANIKQAATAAATGVAELATSAETLTGTDDARVVTPKGAADTYAAKFGAPTVTVGVEGGNVINVAIQLKDAGGTNLAVRGALRAYMSDDANGDSIAAAAASGGVAIGTDGLAMPLIADKLFDLVSESDGSIDLDITEAGAATWYLVLVMPDGRLVASDAITFAP